MEYRNSNSYFEKEIDESYEITDLNDIVEEALIKTWEYRPRKMIFGANSLLKSLVKETE